MRCLSTEDGQHWMTVAVRTVTLSVGRHKQAGSQLAPVLLRAHGFALLSPPGSTVLTTPSVGPGEAGPPGPIVVGLQNLIAPTFVLGTGEAQAPLDFSSTAFHGNTEMACFSGRETMQGTL